MRGVGEGYAETSKIALFVWQRIKALWQWMNKSFDEKTKAKDYFQELFVIW